MSCKFVVWYGVWGRFFRGGFTPFGSHDASNGVTNTRDEGNQDDMLVSVRNQPQDVTQPHGPHELLLRAVKNRQIGISLSVVSMDSIQLPLHVSNARKQGYLRVDRRHHYRDGAVHPNIHLEPWWPSGRVVMVADMVDDFTLVADLKMVAEWRGYLF